MFDKLYPYGGGVSPAACCCTSHRPLHHRRTLERLRGQWEEPQHTTGGHAIQYAWEFWIEMCKEKINNNKSQIITSNN